MLAGASDYRKLISHLHLENAAVRKTHSSKVIHNFIGKLNRNLRVVSTISGRSINLSTVGSR